jgi:hypothetical protein
MPPTEGAIRTDFGRVTLCVPQSHLLFAQECWRAQLRLVCDIAWQCELLALSLARHRFVGATTLIRQLL